MESGRLIQLGPPLEVYEQPGTEFVARFTGASNLLSGEVKETNSQRMLQLRDGTSLPLPPGLALSLGPTLLAVRPEDVRIDRNGPGLPATVQSVTHLGGTIEYRLQAGQMELWVQTGPDQVYGIGERVFVWTNRVVPLGPRHRRARCRGPQREPLR